MTDAGSLPRFGLDPVGSTGHTDYRLPVSQDGEVWSRTLGHVSATLGEWALQSAKQHAEEAGAMAGLDPNYRPDKTTGPLLANASFHAAALKTYSAQLDTKIHTANDQALTQWLQLPEDQRDPKLLQATLDKQKVEIEKADVFDQARPAFETTWSRLSAASLKAADHDFYQRTLDRAKAATLANATAVSDTAHRVASLPTSSDKDIADQVAAHDKIVDQAVNQNQFSAADGEIRKEKFRQSLLATRTLSLFDNLPQGDRAGALEKFRGAYGSGDYYAALRGKESDGDDSAHAKTSSAQGRYQFTDKTWAGLRRNHPELGLTADGRSDPAQQEKAVRAFTADNATELRADGFDASNANLYMAHFLGAPRAKEFLAAMAKNPNADAASLFPAEAKANPTIFAGRSLREVYALQTKRFDGPKTAGLSNDSYDWLIGKMDARVRADAHLAQTARTAALHEISAAKKQIADGYDVTADQWANLSSAYAGSPDEATRGAFEQASRVRGMIAGFVGKPPQEVEATIAGMQAGFKDGGTPQERELVADASKWLATYRKDIAHDPVQRYARDFGAQIAPLDFSTPQALQASLSGRIPVAEQAAKAYGLPAPRLLMESEKAAFKTLAANGGPQMVQAAGALMKAAGARGAGVLKEIGGNDAPAFVQAARVSAWGGEKGFLDDFAEWHRLSSDPATRKAMELPKPERAAPVFDKALGSALWAMPQFSAAARTSAMQAYELRAFRNGWDKTLNDPTARDALARTAQEALGATFLGDTQYGGVATHKMGWWEHEQVLAPGNVRADKFSDVVAALTDDDIKALPAQPLHTDNRPANAETVKGGHFLSVGRGKYEVYKNNPLSRDPQPLRDATGAPWVLDLNALEERLRARIPGAWK